MFEELNNEQRELVKEALRAKEDLAYDKRDFDKMGEVADLIRELDRIGKEGERTHDEGCPHLYGIGHVCADIECPECDKYGYHPTKECPHCGYHTCWCVKEEV
jgi:hypothetical protein